MSKSVSWDDQRTFLAVLEEGSYSAAARQLRLTQPTVRARVESLERDLGVPLFTRSANGLTPTDQARSLGPSIRAMAHASDAFVREATSTSHLAAGTVRLSISEFIGIEVLPPMLARLGHAFPALQFELDLSNTSADLLEQQVDIAVRMYPPKQGALVAKKVGRIALGFYASRDYVAKHGSPEDLASLTAHRLIGPDRNRSDMALAEATVPSIERRHFSLRSDSHPANLALARAGAGIAVAQCPVADLDAGLVRILPEFTIASLDVWIVTHENLRGVARIAAAFDFLVEEFTRLNA